MIGALLVALLGTAQAQDSSEQGFDARGRHLAATDGDLKDPLVTWRPEAQRRGAVGLSGLFEYAEKPLVQYFNHQGEITGPEPLLDNLFGLNLMGTVGLGERAAVTASMPLWFTSTSLDGAQGVGLGDMRLAVPLGIVVPNADEGVGLSVIPVLDLPTGTQTQFLGNRAVSGGAHAALGYGMRRWELDGNVGVHFAPEVDFINITGGPQLLASLGGAVLLDDHHALRAEGIMRNALSASDVPLSQSPSEALLSARGRYDGGLSWTVGGAAGLNGGAGAAAFRIFAGVGFTTGKDKPVGALSRLLVEVVDVNGHPLPDAELTVDDAGQRLDEEALFEAKNLQPGDSVGVVARLAGFEEDDEIVSLDEGDNIVRLVLAELPGVVHVRVEDQDGAPLDARVAAAGDRSRDPSETGADGEVDLTLPAGGWKILGEAEGYGVAGEDIILRRGGETDVTLVLKASKVEVTKDEVLILEKVHFHFDTATIVDDSKPLLQEVANTLLAHPELLLLQVGGHTDARGTHEYNLELSQRRVETVRRYLMDRGVAGDRLVTKGYGENVLLEQGDSESAHAANRRVEFTILKRED